MYPKTATEMTNRSIMDLDVFKKVDAGIKESKTEDPGGEKQYCDHRVFFSYALALANAVPLTRNFL